MDNSYYILEGSALVAVDFDTWCIWFYEDKDGSKRQVAINKMSDVMVSTVFLRFGFDVDVDEPQFFETAVFGGKYNNYEQHYSTYQEAVSGHKRIVAMITGEAQP